MSVQNDLSKKHCYACAAELDVRAELCPKCGVRQPELPKAPIEEDSSLNEYLEIQSRKTVAGILAIVMGQFGIHKFYLGKHTAGIVTLIFGIGTLGYGLFITYPLAIYEGIKYLRLTPKEFEETYIKQKKQWL
ncbi:MAG: NINE protein [Planctomycetaceae bacterium]|nr:NINE protein [Planctomycetaceae bacterium]